MASSNMKDNFLYLAPVANSDLLSYIKQSSIGNVPAETITTLVALILLETPLYKHCTQGCVLRPKGTHTYQNRMEAFIMFSVGLQTLLNFLPAGRICFLCHQATVFFPSFLLFSWLLLYRARHRREGEEKKKMTCFLSPLQRVPG
ncbi:hypothetical protein PAMP_001447 [Pampus punctatissimus]